MLRIVHHALKNVTMARRPPKNPLLVVLGATGTGKSQLAVDLATRFNGEIINGDAMQMYDGLPIITNKISVEEQNGIPHHLLGFIPLDEEPWRIGMFKRKAEQIIKEIQSRGRLPIVVGGTHYYTQSLLFEDSLVTEQDENEEFQTEMSNQEISENFPILDGPTETLIDRLREVDPIMADRWHPNDRRKIRRSLEIFLMTGKKASDIYARQKEAKSIADDLVEEESSSYEQASDTLLFWVHCDAEILKDRLDARVDKMLKAGLLDEVRSMNFFLHKQTTAGITVDRSRGIWGSIGWKEFEEYLTALESGSKSQDELNSLHILSIEQTKAATRQYAKRQTRWIRLKLMPALSGLNALGKLYLLDGSDIKLWADNVSTPAIAIAESFLAGGELRAPSELSNTAERFLAPEKTVEPARQECEICNVTTVTEDQWQKHLSSRRHRQLTKKKQKNASGRSSFTQKANSSALPETP